MKINKVEPIFVNTIPLNLEEGKLYISLKYNAILHKCACGCGKIVSTPTDENGWTLYYKDSKVSLSPSIGNWNYECKSHYFIRNNNIIWLDKEQIYKKNNKIKKRKWWNFLKK